MPKNHLIDETSPYLRQHADQPVDWHPWGEEALRLAQELTRVALRAAPPALEMVETTLDHMADGGLRDQLGGGFCRYSTDRTWLVPHFEKMLTDNALLARVYLHAHLVTGHARYRQVAESTLAFLQRELEHPEGAFTCWPPETDPDRLEDLLENMIETGPAHP